MTEAWEESRGGSSGRLLGMMRGLLIDDMSNSPVTTLDAELVRVLKSILLDWFVKKKPLAGKQDVEKKKYRMRLEADEAK